MSKINLKLMRGKLVATAYEAYDEIMALSHEERDDTNVRTGVQIFIREPGISERNSIFSSIYHPSEDAMAFSVEKAVRSYTLGHAASQNSEDPDKLQYRGSLTVTIDGITIQASCSGLTGDQDVYVSVIILSRIFACSTWHIMNKINEAGGELPEHFAFQNSYFDRLLTKHSTEFSE